MNPFQHEFERLETDLKPFARSFEARARRFFAAFLPVLITAIIAVPPGSFNPVALWGLALSSAVTVLGELDPSIPWSILLRRLDFAARRDPVVTPAKGPTP